MKEQVKTYLGVIVFVTVLILGVLYWQDLLSNPAADTPDTGNSSSITTQVLEESGFKLQLEYTGNNVWNYTLSASLPNPCTDVVVDTLVAESYPEQVTVNVKTTEKDRVCVQVIREYETEGTIRASEKATFKLNVNK